MKKHLFLLTMLFSVIWSTLVYAEDNSGFKANTNHQQEYFDNDYAMNRQQQYPGLWRFFISR